MSVSPGYFTQEFGAEATYNDALDQSNTTRPIFRQVPATTSPSRTFPKLKYIINNPDNPNNPPHREGSLDWITAEELPRIGRTLEFRVTVRDTLGGVTYKPMSVTVAPNTGPFKITAPPGACFNSSVSPFSSKMFV